MKNYTFEVPCGKIIFRPECGGFPAEVEIREFGGEQFCFRQNIRNKIEFLKQICHSSSLEEKNDVRK